MEHVVCWCIRAWTEEFERCVCFIEVRYTNILQSTDVDSRQGRRPCSGSKQTVRGCCARWGGQHSMLSSGIWYCVRYWHY